jgi:hypothetical protein
VKITIIIARTPQSCSDTWSFLKELLSVSKDSTQLLEYFSVC